MPTAGWWEATVAQYTANGFACLHPCCFLGQHQAGVETGSESSAAIFTFVPGRSYSRGSGVTM